MSARKTAITCASAACLAMAVPAVQKYEGYAPTVVPDRLAGGLPTGGYGETEGVKLGETHDRKFWADRLAKRLAEEYDAGIGQCIKVELPDGVRAMAISASYNAGVAAVCESPMVRKWNAGDIEGGCRAILTQNAQGQYTGWRICSRPGGPGTPCIVQPGLINRRADEKRKCLAGISVPAPKRTTFDPPVVYPPGGSDNATPRAGCGQDGLHCPETGPKMQAPVNPPISETKPAACPAPQASWWSRVWCWIFKCGVKA